MTYNFKLFFTCLLLTLMSISQSNADSYKELPSLYDLQKQKIEAFKQQSKQTNRHINGGYTVFQDSVVSPVNTGFVETMLFAKNANVRIVGDIGFYIDKMIGRLRANDSTQPIILDNPQSFSIDVLSGDLVLGPKAIEAILNEHIFNFLTSTLKKLKVRAVKDYLILDGFVKRKGVWIPFNMKGDLTVKQGRYLVLKARQVSLGGNDGTQLLKVGRIELDELLTIKAPGAILKGSSIWLDSLKLLPPPQINFVVEGVEVSGEGVRLKMKKQADADFPAPFTTRDSYMILRSGDMRVMRLLTLNAELNIIAKQENEILDFSFYDYRRQINEGSMILMKDGRALVSIENYKHLDN